MSSSTRRVRISSDSSMRACTVGHISSIDALFRAEQTRSRLLRANQPADALTMTTVEVGESARNRLLPIRFELDLLVRARTSDGEFTHGDQDRYDRLCQAELDLLGGVRN